MAFANDEFYLRRYTTEILPIRRKTLYNQSMISIFFN